MYRDFAILRRPDDYKRSEFFVSKKEQETKRERLKSGRKDKHGKKLKGKTYVPEYLPFAKLASDEYRAEQSEQALDGLKQAKDAVGEALGNLFSF
jgi:hypothetical protein